MSAKHRARVALQRIGLDVVRYPDQRQEHITVGVLNRLGVDLVLDVGANDGGYGRGLRQFGYRREIVSFEPLSTTFGRLSASIATDPRWTAEQCALGDVDKQLTMNIASNSEASSSALQMLDRHLAAAPGSVYLGTETVRQRRLDDVWRERSGTTSRPFLKIDVQGYEGFVLDGAPDLVRSAVGVQLEVSTVPLYEGALTLVQAIERMEAAGFFLAHFFPGLRDQATGDLLQADGLFLRRNGS